MENQLTILGVYGNELPKEFFDRVPFKDDLLTIEISDKDTLQSVCIPLRKKYPKFKKEIKSFANTIYGMAASDSTINLPLLLNTQDLKSAVLHLTVL